MANKLHLSLLAAAVAAVLGAPPAAFAVELLPYHNTCDDLSTVTVVDNGTRKWQTYNRGNVYNPDYVFRHQPNGTGASVVATATLWTPELALEAGHAYEVSAVVAVTRSAATSKAVLGLYSSPETGASEVLTLGTVSPVPVRPSSGSWPVHTYYVLADESTPRYLGVANRGGGNYSYFMVDDIMVREIDPMMPVAATGFTATAQGKTVALSFKLPETSTVGLPLTTVDVVRLMCNGRIIKEWSAAEAGTVLSFEDRRSVIGAYDYAVVCANNGSDGPAAVTTVAVGPSKAALTPTVNSNYQAFLDDGETRFGRNYLAPAVYVPGEGVKVSWQPYDAGDGVEVSYTVTRVQDGKLVAGNVSGLSAMDADALAADAAMYTYVVKAAYGDTEKDIYVSSTVTTHLPTPFEAAFTPEALLEFTVIDNNHDMSTWGQNTIDQAKHGVDRGFYTKVGDDYLVTPGIDLRGGTTYRVDIDAFSNDIVAKTVGFSVVAGNSNAIDAMTTEIMPETVLSNLVARGFSAYYTPQDDGMMFFAVRGLNPGDRDAWDNLGVSRFDVTEVPGTLPESVAGLKVEYTSTPGVVNLRFDAPLKDVAGADLDAIERIEVTCNGIVKEVIENPLPGSAQVVEVTVELGSQDTYSVVPYTVSGAGIAQTVEVMILEPPYENYFDTPASLTGFTVLNPGQSGYQWSYQANAARSYPSETHGHDSYLVSPPVHLEGGWFYKVDFLTWLGSVPPVNNNQIELLIGTSPDADALTTPVVAPYTVNGDSDGRALVKEWFSVPETGEYYLAWHSSSPAGSAAQLYIDDIKLSAKMDPTHPGAVTGLSVTPDASGELKATVAFTLPATDLAGNPLSGNIYQWRILRDNVEVKNNYSAAPGTEVVFEDTGISEGVHLYTVVCDGYFDRKASPSREVSTVVFVGVNRPGRVPFVTAEETPGNYGEVTIEWDVPQADCQGFPLNTTDITYTVGQLVADMMTGNITEKIFQTGVTGTSLTVKVKDDADTQDFCRFFVRGATSGGESPTTVVTRHIAVGKPYELPLAESFAGSRPAIAVMTQVTGDGSGAAWGFNTVNPVTGVASVDGDNGLAMCEVMFIGGGARMFTGRVDLAAEHPVATFWVYNQTKPSLTDTNLLALQVREGDSEFVDVARKTVDEWACGLTGWQKVSVDLSDYADKVVYLGFDAQAQAYTFTHIDAVKISRLNPTDLGVTSISHDKVYVGVNHDIEVSVVNHGGAQAAGGRLMLKLDGAPVETRELPGIAPGASVTERFVSQLGRDQLGRHAYSVELEIADDADMTDNFRTAAVFEVSDNDFPGVANLVGTPRPDRVEIKWDDPVLPVSPTPVTIDCEDYDSWLTIATGIGDWTLVDGDKGGVGGFKTMELPNVPMYSRQSFVVFDFSYGDFPKDARYNAHSGDKVLGSMYNADPTVWVNDMLISPRLCGSAQTISFWARGFSDEFPESFSVKCSTGTTDLHDFAGEAIAREVNLGGEWRKFSYELPEGTRHFMIEHYSGGGYFLFLDDFEFTPEGAETLVGQGFNVYRNDEKVTQAPVADKCWSDMEPVESPVTYGVTAVYDRGESPMQTVTVAWTGLDEITGVDVAIFVDNHDIVVKGPAGLDISVINPAGLALTSLTGTGTDRVTVAPGVYVVRAGAVVTKVAVK